MVSHLFRFAGLSAVGALALAGCGPELGSDFPSEPHAVDQSEIVGGSNTTIAQHPWQVSFQNSAGSHFCGASILSDRWILTAQHCVDGDGPSITSPFAVRIAAGSTTLSGMASAGQIRNVEEVIVFPGYVNVDQGKDVALLRLSAPLTLGANVNTITLATPSDEAAGYTNPGVTSNVSGWGALSSGGSSPDILQAVNVPIVSNAQASALYGSTITADQLAAGDTVNGGEDSCQGDSGGPLTVAKGTARILAGVVSWGNGCADVRYPGLYARVSSFQSWISSTMTKTPSTLATYGNLSAARRGWVHLTLNVPAGTPLLNVHAFGGTGDGDMYVRYGSQPTTKAYDCRPYKGGNNESCTFSNPQAGTWYISLFGYTAFSGASVKATTLQ